MKVGLTLHHLRLLARTGERRQKQTDQNRDDSDHYEQFDETECATGRCFIQTHNGCESASRDARAQDFKEEIGERLFVPRVSTRGHGLKTHATDAGDENRHRR